VEYLCKHGTFIEPLSAGFGYIYAKIFHRQEVNLENFMINRFGAPLYHMFFEDYTKKVWGIHPKDLSPDWGAQRIKGIIFIWRCSSGT
jgi:UDP-galactopyranose mutase